MKVLSVVGARPQFIKAAPVSEALRRRLDEVLVHTGQHYDPTMSAVFFDELGLPHPDVDLEVGSGAHGAQTAAMLRGLEGVIRAEAPQWVLVYGDTNSTLAGALAASKLQVPVAHIEAGLRSGREDMPEELNRILVDHVARILFAPTQTAMGHLQREGLGDRSRHVGDVMVDALRRLEHRLEPSVARRFGVEAPYLVATLHRAENVDNPARLQRAFELLGAMPLRVVLPVHPRTRGAMAAAGMRTPPNVVDTEPISYLTMMSLVAQATGVLTDSGGLQKEAALLGTRCVTLRPETEWPETVDSGWNSVVDLDKQAALEALAIPLPAQRTTAFGDGTASEAIVTTLLEQ